MNNKMPPFQANESHLENINDFFSSSAVYYILKCVSCILNLVKKHYL